MTNPTERLVDAHLAAFCAADAAARQDEVARIWSKEGRLVDPPMESSGHAGIAGQYGQLVAQFPGHRFERTTDVDAHHGFLRYGWRLRDAAGHTALEGMDILELDVDGRIGRVVGFFGSEPPRLAG